MGARTVITHVTTFLLGVFIASFLSAVHLTHHAADNIISSGNWGGDVSNFIRGDSSANVRSSSSSTSAKVNDAIINENSELRKSLRDEQLQKEKLQSTIAKLIGGTPISPEPGSVEESVQQTLLQSYNSHYERTQTPKNTMHDLCSILPQPTPTTLSYWSHHLPHILNATKHSSDQSEYQYHDFTALLLHFLTPDRLQRGVKTLPLDWTPVQRGLDIIYKRLTFIRKEVDAYRKKNNIQRSEEIPSNALQDIQKNPKIPRKLNVLVMGGSVTMGVVCHINPVSGTGIARRSCAWPGRMDFFFSQLFGGYELIHFHTIALGGTNTESGITMWDYSLLPDDVPYPDVVINAYATNDMHYNSVQDAIAKNITLERSVLELTQAFIRQLLTPKKECEHPPPLLIYLDDYLGNEQNEVLATLISSQAIHLMSGYYGLGSISYADAVRDIVYGDNKEWWFSSNWHEGGKYQRAVHPHMGMHISSTWIVSYYLMNLVSAYCSLPDVEGALGEQTTQQRLHAGIEQHSQGVWDYGYRPHDGLPQLRATKQLIGGPKQKPRGIPPPLTETLSLEHISQQWQEETELKANLWKSGNECSAEGHPYDSTDVAALPKPCLYSWVANLERFLDNPKRLTDRIKPVLASNEGWSAADDNGKLGWVPSSGIGSKFTLEWKSVAQPVRAVTWMIMRSYGEKWENSRVKIEVWSDNKLMTAEEVVGFHDKKTSETYNIKMKLGATSGTNKSGDVTSNSGGVSVGEDLRVTFELVGGSTFKISGMAICDH